MSLIAEYTTMRPLSASRLAQFRKSEVLFLEEAASEDTEAKLVGRAAHALILEGRAVYESRFAEEGPINPKTGAAFGLGTKAIEEWEKESGRKALGYKNAAIVEAMAESALKHERAASLIAGGQPEAWIEAEYCGIRCHGRIDLITLEGAVVDFKTCADLDSFEGDARRNDYAYQLAFYRALLASKRKCRPQDIECFFLAAEKAVPFRCGLWRIGGGVLGLAQQQNEEAIERLKRCYASKKWRTGYEDTREFDWI